MNWRQLPLLLTPLVLSACASPLLYNTGQAWQRDQCQRIQDFQERSRCMARAGMSPEEYQRQTEGLRRGTATP